MSEAPVTCKDYVWKVGPYVDGELPLDERDGLESHLETCGDCRELAESFRTLDRVASGAGAPPVTGREWATLLDNVKNGQLPAVSDVEDGASMSDQEANVIPMSSESRRGGRDWLVPILSLAALLLIAVVLGKSFLAGDSNTSGPGSSASTAHEATNGTSKGDPEIPIQSGTNKTDEEDRRDSKELREVREDF